MSGLWETICAIFMWVGGAVILGVMVMIGYIFVLSVDRQDPDDFGV